MDEFEEAVSYMIYPAGKPVIKCTIDIFRSIQAYQSNIKVYYYLWKINIAIFIFLPYLFTITMSTIAFDPFSLKKGVQYSKSAKFIQEIIYYAESRFRAILTTSLAYRERDLDRSIWIQTLLRREYVSRFF